MNFNMGSAPTGGGGNLGNVGASLGGAGGSLSGAGSSLGGASNSLGGAGSLGGTNGSMGESTNPLESVIPGASDGANDGAKKTGMAGQASDMLDQGMSMISGEQVGPKVGTDASKLGTKQTINEETGEITEEPAYQPGDKVGNGKVVDEDGKVQGSNTRRLLTDVGTAAAIAGTGSEEAGDAVYDIGQNSEIVGKVADELDKVPGVEELSGELEEAGVMDTAEGAFEAFKSAENGDIEGTVEAGKKVLKGVEKFRNKFIQMMLIVLIPIIVLFLFIVTLIAVVVEYGPELIVNYVKESISDTFDSITENLSIIVPGSQTSGKTTSETDLKLKKYFPDGVPTTKEEMKPYLVTITVPITTKEGEKTTKKITVHKDVADQVKDVLQKAQDAGFKVYSVGAYNFRTIRGSSNKLSQHSYGLAIDINANENYYISGNSKIGTLYSPGENEYSMPEDGIVVQTFKSYGWDWGGNWKNPKDYMHFSAAGG